MGRRKIEIKKIEKKKRLRVTFSKRRQGLFKKGAELCALTGAQIALLAFSPGGKPYSFGHSSVESVIQDYCNGTIPTMTFLDYDCLINYNDVQEQEQQQQQQQQRGCSGFWWENLCLEENNDLDELEHLESRLQKLSDNVSKRLKLGSADDHALAVVLASPDCSSSLLPAEEESMGGVSRDEMKEVEDFLMMDDDINEYVDVDYLNYLAWESNIDDIIEYLDVDYLNSLAGESNIY